MHSYKWIMAFKQTRNMTIPEKITQIRESQGLTKKSLADLTGTSRSRIYRIEKGIENPGLDILERIAKALECRIDMIEN